MHDPVVLSDGHTYERHCIERWLQEHDTSPVTGAKLGSGSAFPNHALRNAVEEYFQQVFCAHRHAIRSTLQGGGSTEQPGLSGNAALIHTVDALMQCSLLVNAELSTEQMLRQIIGEAKTLVGAEAASVFLVDRDRQELYSTVNSTSGELRIPIGAGIAGHVARTGEALRICDAYEDARFDRSVDAKTGFRSRNILCVPLKRRGAGVLGVAQLINKTGAGVLSADSWQEDGAAGTSAESSVDERQPVGFTPEDLQFLQVFASQAATAVADSAALEKLRPHEASDSLETSSAIKGTPPQTLMQAGATDEDPSHPLVTRRCKRKHCQFFSDADLEVLAESVAASSLVDVAHAAEVGELLSAAFEGWQTDTLALAELTGERPLTVLGLHLFDRLGLAERFSLDQGKLERFLAEIERGYDAGIPYHNRAHATSVLHMMHALLSHGGLFEAVAPAFGGEDNDGQLERMACLLAAAIHDYEHKGLSNDFLVRTQDERALQYNDKHVNENHHLASAFAVLRRPECNFLEHLPVADQRRLRSLVVELVLATDMAEHAAIMKRFAEATGGPAAEFTPTSSKDAVLLLQVAIKCADVGHLALGWELHGRWVERLEEEFFAQGDREKALGLDPVSFLMDRDKPGVSQTQTGFFEHVALPLYRALASAVPRAGPMLLAVEANHTRWCAEYAAKSSAN